MRDRKKRQKSRKREGEEGRERERNKERKGKREREGGRDSSCTNVWPFISQDFEDVKELKERSNNSLSVIGTSI